MSASTNWEDVYRVQSARIAVLECENATLRDKLAVLERDYAALDDRYERLVEKEAQP